MVVYGRTLMCCVNDCYVQIERFVHEPSEHHEQHVMIQNAEHITNGLRIEENYFKLEHKIRSTRS
jgi:hypothetical protein